MATLISTRKYNQYPFTEQDKVCWSIVQNVEKDIIRRKVINQMLGVIMRNFIFQRVHIKFSTILSFVSKLNKLNFEINVSKLILLFTFFIKAIQKSPQDALVKC